MKVTENDQKIYDYISKTGFATVKQISNIFYSDILYGPTLAKKRLNCLIEHGYIKKIKSSDCNQDIFYEDSKFRRQSKHNILVMDVYSCFRKIDSLNVINFEVNKQWGIDHKIYSDAFLTVEYNAYDNIFTQNFIIEVETSKTKYKNPLYRYNDVEIDTDIRAACSGFAPVIILIDNIKHNKDFYLQCSYQVCHLDESLCGFPLVFSYK